MMSRHTASRTKAAVAIVLLSLLGAACVVAGFWQLHRAQMRDALYAAILAGQRASPTTLDAQHPQAPQWHRANATGRWLDRFTVLLDNRNLKGNPGFWVATPLDLAGASGTALLVLRGWVARPLPPATLPDLRGTPGIVHIEGTSLARVPRMFDLGSMTGHPDTVLPTHWSADAPALPTVQNLSLAALQAATGLEFLPVVLEQTSPDGAGLIRDWPGPSVDSRQNLNYAFQWFSFAAIAIGAAVMVFWRTWLRRTAAGAAHPPAST